jgi:uncharacterized membrane protein YqgA involved in biofilm formation
MVGTLYNAIAVGIGASTGLLLGKNISRKLQAQVFKALGLFTLGLGFSMSLEMNQPFAVFLALVFGIIAGHQLQIDQRLRRITDRLGEGTGYGLIQSVLLFCAGAMTLVGCMQDGLQNDPTILFIKGTMDLVSSALLAATLGRGVLLAAPAILILQGGLTGAFQLWGGAWPAELIADLTGLGGLLLLALGIDLMKIQSFALLNFIPAFVLVPFFRPVAIWIQVEMPLLLVF